MPVKDGAVIQNWTRFSVRHRKLVLLLWILLVVCTLPLAVKVTKHLTTNGFESPQSQVHWATNQLSHFKPQPAPVPLLIRHMPSGIAKSHAKAIGVPISLLHRIGAQKTVFVPPSSFSLVKESQLQRAITAHGGTTQVVSQKAVGHVVTHDAARTLATSGVLAMPILAVLLLLVFGSVLAVSLPLIIALAGAEVALAAVRVISLHMQLSVFLTDIVSFLALGVGVDYALFISTRFRRNLDDGMAVEDAVADSMTHAGRSVLYSGIAVAFAVMALIFGNNAYWQGLAVGGGVAIFSVLLATHTLLPAVMGLYGEHIHWGRIKRIDFGLWRALSRWVTQHAGWAIVVSLVVLLPLASLAPQIQMSTPANLATMLPRSDLLRRAVEKQQDIQGPGVIAPIAVVARLPKPLSHEANWGAVERLTNHLKRLSNVKSVSSPTLLGASPAQLSSTIAHPHHALPTLRRALQTFVAPKDARLVVVYVVAKSGPNQLGTSRLVGQIDQHLAGWLPAGTRASAGGLVPVLRAFNRTTQSRIPLIIASALAVALVVLTAATRSILQAVMGVVFDGFVALATAGFLVFVNHHQLLGFERQPLDSSITPLIFVLLFGLSMDYEVILLHRIQERWLLGDSPRDAIQGGVATTGSMITGAGMIMVVVFLALLISPLQIMKTLGIGLSFAVLADTWVVRSLLVPSVTTLLGRWGFWPWRPKRPAGMTGHP